jgi:hypothetical protein
MPELQSNPTLMGRSQDLKLLLLDQPRLPIHFDFSALELGIAESVRYLNSSEAHESIEANPYWPKWHSPWWHLSAFFEMGLAHRIPKAVAVKLLAEVKATHLPFFFREEAPLEKSPKQDAPCPCSFGNIYQILSATGLDVDAELPWARGWFLKYQMSDGGLNCDEDAYKADQNASSMVGTISPLEAILSTPGKLTTDEINFLDRGARCLLDRELRLGSKSQHNAEERLDEEDWLKPCFPRLYFYDVLRGLSFVLHWSEVLSRPIPASAILNVVRHLSTQFPDGKIRTQRHSYEDVTTRALDSSGNWERGRTATFFPLLNETSDLGNVSPFLTHKWQDAILIMDRLLERGLIT